MPVVDRDKERAIVERALQRGMSQDQIKQAVTAFRTKAGQTQQATSQEQPGGFKSFVQGVAKPFAKVGASVLNIGETVGDLGRAGVAALQGDKEKASELVSEANRDIRQERSFGYLGNARPVGISQTTGQDLSPGRTALDVAGTGAEIASFAVPASGAVKGAKTVGQVGLRALPRVAADQAALGAAAGVLGGAGQEAQKEDATARSIAGAGAFGGAVGAGIGAAIPTAGALARGATNTIGRIGAEVLGRSTGAGEAAIREAFSNPNVVKYARGAGKEGPEGLMTQALEDAQKGLKTLKQKRGAAYEKELNLIKLDKTQMDSILQDSRRVARDLLGSSGVTVDESAGKLLNKLSFENSTIERGQGTVQKAFNDVMKWRDTTPAGLDKLKKKLSQHLDEIPVTERGGAFQFVLDLKNSVDSRLKSDVPGYQQMTSKYSEASDLIDEIQRALSLKDTAAKDTAIRKLMSTMRQNNELRKEMLDVLGAVAGRDISGKIAGATLSTATPRGLAGVLQPQIGGVGAVSSFINPSTIPWLITYLAISSPRLVAEAVAVLSKIKGPTIPAVYRQQLRNLLIKAANEGPSSDESSGGPQGALSSQ